MNKKEKQKILKQYLDKLLIFTGRNPLINSANKKNIVNIIDEIPDQILETLQEGELELISLPEGIKQEIPKDEQNKKFEKKLLELKNTNKEYRSSIEDANEKYAFKLENDLRDLIRKEFEMNKIERKESLTKKEIATKNNLDSDFNFKLKSESNEKKHLDKKIQLFLTTEEFKKRVQKLYSEHNRYIRDRGLNPLFLVIGLISSTDETSKNTYKSPLFIVKLKLRKERSGEGFKFYVELEEDLILNPAICKKLHDEMGVTLPKIKIDETEKIIKYFKTLKTKESELNKKEIYFEKKMLIGIFPSKIQSYDDLSKIISNEDLNSNSFDKLIFGANDGVISTDIDDGEDFVDYKTSINNSFLDLDHSQRTVVNKALDGESFVIEGPPGTGKSQTIIEIIIQSILSGKKVLFVAEKRAAIEVIKKRMKEYGNLDIFLLPILAETSDRKNIIKNIEETFNKKRSQTNKTDLKKEKDKILKNYYILQELKNVLENEITFDDEKITFGEFFDKNLNTKEDFRSLPTELKAINLNVDIQIDHELITKKIKEYGLHLKNTKGFDADLKKITKICQIDNMEILNMCEEAFSKSELLDKKEQHLKTFNISGEMFKSRDGDFFVAHQFYTLLNNQKKEELKFILNLVISKEKQVILNEFLNKLETAKNEYDSLNNDYKTYTKILESFSNIVREDMYLNSLKVNTLFELSKIIKEAPIDLLNSEFILSTQEEKEKLNTFKTNEIKFKKIRKNIDKTFYINKVDKNNFKEKLESLELGKLFFISKKEREYFKPIFKHDLPFLNNIFRVLLVREIKKIQIFFDLEEKFEKGKNNLYEYFNNTNLDDENIEKYIKQFNFFEELNKLSSDVNPEELKVSLIKLFKNKNFPNVTEELTPKFTEDITYKQLSEKNSGIIEKLNKIKNEVIENTAVKEIIDDRFNGINTDEKQIKDLLVRANVISEFLSENKIGSIFVETLSKLEDIEDIFELFFSIETLEKEVGGLVLKLRTSILGLSEFENNYKRYEFFKQISNDKERLGNWLELKDVESFFETNDLLNFIKVIQDIDDFENASKYFKILFKYLKFNNLISSNENFKNVFENYDCDKNKLFNEMNECKNKAFKLEQEIIFNTLVKNGHDGVKYNLDKSKGVKEKTEGFLIEHEITKSKSFLPVKHLIEKAPESLLSLKPCWAMSPEAVSMYLPQNFKFDLIVIDEASQIYTENILSSIYRANQCIIVGDQNQLPPSSFFMSRNSDEVDSVGDDEKSILDNALTAFNKKQLRYHYRSEDPKLIAFCNKYIYKDTLVLAPKIMHTKNDETGIFHEKVSCEVGDMVYKNGVNPLEANLIIKRLKEFTKDRENHKYSLAIVVMNVSQRDHIEEVLFQHELDENTSDYIERWKTTEEPFIIKNLENIQGDERDIIFIGTVYGPEECNGKVAQRFGPINSENGWKRLNVLFSRAKKKIVTFSSMQQSDILEQKNFNKKDGKEMLKNWLIYSESKGENLLIGETTDRQPDSDFEIDVAKEIEKLGYEYEVQVGESGFFIDIGVKQKGIFIAGVECDGRTYHSKPEDIRNDRHRQTILEDRGWNIYRVYSVDWFNERANEIEKLKEYLRSL